MLYETGAFDATLAAAAGDDHVLLTELRTAFGESVERQIDLLERARCDGNWNVAAMRLKGLGATFHSANLITLADEALETVPGDPALLRRLKEYQQDFSATF